MTRRLFVDKYPPPSITRSIFIVDAHSRAHTIARTHAINHQRTSYTTVNLVSDARLCRASEVGVGRQAADPDNVSFHKLNLTHLHQTCVTSWRLQKAFPVTIKLACAALKQTPSNALTQRKCNVT